MPLPFLAELYVNGTPAWMPDAWLLGRAAAAVGVVALAKVYFGGRRNGSERNMHGKVVLVTGGTSGVGAAAALELARRGAQVVLLTRQPASHPLVVELVDELRARAGHEMVYAEQVDLASLLSVRRFATRWLDNVPPRRLDAVVLCAATRPVSGATRELVGPGQVERTWMVNYLANFHLLALLSPALRAQPPDRDVRVILPTCPAYIGATPLSQPLDAAAWTPGQAYARSKLALMTFGRAFQKHLDAQPRPDGLPANARVVLADPGYCRTPGTTLWLAGGSRLGLVVYALLYWAWWLFLKSPAMGAQPLLFAAMDPAVIRTPGARLVKDCREVDPARRDIDDEAVAKQLWEASDRLVEEAEKAEVLAKAAEKHGDGDEGAEQADAAKPPAPSKARSRKKKPSGT